MNSYSTEFWLVFVASSLGMLLLAGSIVFFVIFYQRRMLQHKVREQQLTADYQIKMLQATLESQELERRRIAAELHDSIGGLLSAVRVNLFNMLKKGATEQSINMQKELIDQSIETLRAIGRDLMPLSLERLGLSSAIKDLCSQLAASTGIDIIFNEEGEVITLSQKQAIALFRVLQEILNNALKHANTQKIEMKFKWANALEISVCDYGKGFDFEHHKEKSNGLGLFNIENRLKSISAKYTFQKDTTLGMTTNIYINL